MENIIAIIAIAALLGGCTSKTEYGECIGFAKNENPNLKYSYSYWNIFVAFIFSETIIVLVVVAADQYKCPVENK